jgi:hypothetical protein
VGTYKVNAVKGVATFSNVSIHSAGNYKILASSGTITTIRSGNFSIAPAAPTQMVILQNTSNTVAGSSMRAIELKFLDAFGNLAVNNHGTVTLTLAGAPSGGALVGNLNDRINKGIVTFNKVTLRVHGSYILHAAFGGMSLNTAGFTVLPAAAKQLVFHQPPLAAVHGEIIAPAIIVDVVDAFGNLVTFSAAIITLAVQSGPKGASFTNVSTAALNGEATFDDVSLATAGAYKLKASVTGFASVISNSFVITP